MLKKPVVGDDQDDIEVNWLASYYKDRLGVDYRSQYQSKKDKKHNAYEGGSRTENTLHTRAASPPDAHLREDTHHTNHHPHVHTHIENTDDKLMNQLMTEFEAVGGVGRPSDKV